MSLVMADGHQSGTGGSFRDGKILRFPSAIKIETFANGHIELLQSVSGQTLF